MKGILTMWFFLLYQSIGHFYSEIYIAKEYVFFVSPKQFQSLNSNDPPSIWDAVCSKGRLARLIPSPWAHCDRADSGTPSSSAISGFSGFPHLPLGGPC